MKEGKKKPNNSRYFVENANQTFIPMNFYGFNYLAYDYLIYALVALLSFDLCLSVNS